MVKVKICGITNSGDAKMAVHMGANALGFIFAPSPREIKPENAREIIRALPPFVKAVGIFVNEESLRIRQIVHFCGLDLVQLHGDEPPPMCEEFMPRTIKAFQIRDESSLRRIKPYGEGVRAILLDTYAKDKRGGTGSTFDWDLAVKGKAFGIPIILSGGLNPSNVGKAISTVKPFAVDINSGVEESPGKKSPDLMKSLMETIQEETIP